MNSKYPLCHVTTIYSASEVAIEYGMEVGVSFSDRNRSAYITGCRKQAILDSPKVEEVEITPILSLLLQLRIRGCFREVMGAI